MKREEIEILEDIKLIEKRQGLLLGEAKTPQQELLQIFGQRHLLSKKMLHKKIEEVLAYLPGTFGSLTLSVSYMALCLQNHIQLPPEHYPILKLLIDWTEVFPTFRAMPEVNLTDIVMQRDEPLQLNTLEQYITYLNFIGADIVKVVRRPKGDNLDESLNSSTANVREASDRYGYDHINPENLLQFVNLSLPKILINVLLPNESMPAQFRKQMQNMQCLYKNASLEYFMRSKPQYASLIKILFKILVGLELKAAQQKQLMDIAFRYFYAYHHDKKYNATELFIQTYNSLSQPTRFALSDQFILFFRIARKIGKGKFVDFLISKSPWLKDITSKISEKSMIGYTKEGIQPYNSLGLGENILIPSGKVQTRSFEVLEDYSLFYFRIAVNSLDVTIRLYYLGDINSPKPIKTLLFEHQKKSGALATNVVAAKRGIYQFQFDNTYSWVNSKTIHYENVILIPMQLQGVDRFKWISSYYDEIPSNQFANKEKLFIMQKKAPKKEEVYTGTANITKEGPYYNLKITTNTQIYEFESENEQRFIRKFNQLVSSAGNIKWMIAGEPIEDPETVQGFVSDSKQPATGVSKEVESVPAVKKQTIEVNYEEEDNEGESGVARE